MSENENAWKALRTVTEAAGTPRTDVEKRHMICEIMSRHDDGTYTDQWFVERVLELADHAVYGDRTSQATEYLKSKGYKVDSGVWEMDVTVRVRIDASDLRPGCLPPRRGQPDAHDRDFVAAVSQRLNSLKLDSMGAKVLQVLHVNTTNVNQVF